MNESRRVWSGGPMMKELALQQRTVELIRNLSYGWNQLGNSESRNIYDLCSNRSRTGPHQLSREWRIQIEWTMIPTSPNTLSLDAVTGHTSSPILVCNNTFSDSSIGSSRLKPLTNDQDTFAPFQNYIYKIYIIVKILHCSLLPVIPTFNTGSGPILVYLSFLHLALRTYIQSAVDLRLNSVSTQQILLKSDTKLVYLLRYLHVCLSFPFLDNFVAEILLVTNYVLHKRIQCFEMFWKLWQEQCNMYRVPTRVQSKRLFHISKYIGLVLGSVCQKDFKSEKANSVISYKPCTSLDARRPCCAWNLQFQVFPVFCWTLEPANYIMLSVSKSFGLSECIEN